MDGRFHPSWPPAALLPLPSPTGSYPRDNISLGGSVRSTGMKPRAVALQHPRRGVVGGSLRVPLPRRRLPGPHTAGLPCPGFPGRLPCSSVCFALHPSSREGSVLAAGLQWDMTQLMTELSIRPRDPGTGGRCSQASDQATSAWLVWSLSRGLCPGAHLSRLFPVAWPT